MTRTHSTGSLALNRLAKSKGWRLYEWSKDSCAVNDTDLYLDVYDRAYPECRAWRNSVEQRLSTLGSVDHLIVARSWKYSDYLMQGGQRIKGDAAISATWRAGAAQTFDRLTRISHDVLVLRDGPRAGSNIPTCCPRIPATRSRVALSGQDTLTWTTCSPRPSAKQPSTGRECASPIPQI